MNYAELRRAVRGYGYNVGNLLAHSPWRDSYLRLPRTGGFPVEYTEEHVRLIVAWLAWLTLTGHVSSGGSGHGSRMVRRAARQTAESKPGWVSISEGWVGWHLRPPVHLLNTGVACVRTPEWKETPGGASHPSIGESGTPTNLRK